jgi:uncharacterized protein YxeA
MADKNNSFGEIKKAIIGVVTLAITTAGGLFIANMEKIFDSNDEVKQEVVSEPIKESSKDTIVVIKKETPVVAKPEPPEKKEFEW